MDTRGHGLGAVVEMTDWQAAGIVAAGFLFALALDLRGVWDKLLRKIGIE